MQIKQAKDESESKTLKAVKRSDIGVMGLMVGAFVLFFGYTFVPQNIKDKLAPAAAAGMGGVGVFLKLGLKSIKDGRLDVGDLSSQVENYALLTQGEKFNLSRVQDFVSGDKELHEIPAVQNIIAEQVQAKVGDRIAEIERVAEAAKAPVTVATVEKVRVLEENWVPPV